MSKKYYVVYFKKCTIVFIMNMENFKCHLKQYINFNNALKYLKDFVF